MTPFYLVLCLTVVCLANLFEYSTHTHAHEQVPRAGERRPGRGCVLELLYTITVLAERAHCAFLSLVVAREHARGQTC